MVLARRKGAKGCPACKGDLVTKDNSLARRFPKLGKEFLEAKNGLELYPMSVTAQVAEFGGTAPNATTSGKLQFRIELSSVHRVRTVANHRS
jgi:hypothetical protein